MSEEYISFDEIPNECGARIHISFTPNNGHRVQIIDDQDWACFDFDTPEQIKAVAAQLLDIAERSHFPLPHT